ncbi:Os01g0606166 [Oryza sativa Japonica Group]|uniref:Os01g0606166 protein n=1 Tax=Oryza sativa subsp. japonica TaxID=39947 RepID=A0A0N7KDA5_ORYSJ|nr:hypothetical protein EE612_003956 [Oryza sativa]BAS73073.1 Os01g0606166 [Oryza sativa Japonica Group]
MLPASSRIWNLQNMKMASATPTKTKPTTISPSPSFFHDTSSIRHAAAFSASAAATSAYTRLRSLTATAATAAAAPPSGSASSRSAHDDHPSLLPTRRSVAPPPTATVPSLRTATAAGEGGVRAPDTARAAPSSMSTRRRRPVLGWPTSRNPRLTCAAREASGSGPPYAGEGGSAARSPSGDTL